MPPLLALLICTLLVLVLLWQERKWSRGLSPAVWIPTLWMLIAASRSFPSWFVYRVNVTGSNADGNWLDQCALLVLASMAVAVLIRRRFNWRSAARQHTWLLVLLGYMLVSTLWSDISFIAARRWVRDAIAPLMALVIASEPNPRKALSSVIRRCAYILLPFSLVLIKYYPLLGRAYSRWSGVVMWTGVTTQKNQLGRLCMLSIFILGWMLFRHWRERSRPSMRGGVLADAFVIVLAFYLLLGAHSATSDATLLAGVAIYTGLQWCRRVRLNVSQFALIISVASVIAFGALAPFVGGANIAEFSHALDRSKTLTGRTEIWAAVLPAFHDHPFVGYGYGSFWTDARRSLYFDMPTAHNGYLDILLQTGFVGLALSTIWLIACAKQMHQALRKDYQWASIAISLLLMTIVYNATESTLNTLGQQLTAVTLLALVAVQSAARQRASVATGFRKALAFKKMDTRMLSPEALTASARQGDG